MKVTCTCKICSKTYTADVGTDENTPVVLAYAKKEKFTGKINKVTIETRK